MITEDYISFETAKLLKEKGFDERVKSYFTDGGLEGYMFGTGQKSNSELEDCFYSRPTLQMVMKWLREVHKIEIRVVYDNDRLSWYGACNPMNEPSQILLGSGRKSKSYEEACESGIRYCLENLI